MQEVGSASCGGPSWPENLPAGCVLGRGERPDFSQEQKQGKREGEECQVLRFKPKAWFSFLSKSSMPVVCCCGVTSRCSYVLKVVTFLLFTCFEAGEQWGLANGVMHRSMGFSVVPASPLGALGFVLHGRLQRWLCASCCDQASGGLFVWQALYLSTVSF